MSRTCFLVIARGIVLMPRVVALDTFGVVILTLAAIRFRKHLV